MIEIYKKKLNDILNECFVHLEKLEEALIELKKNVSFPLNENSYDKIINDKILLAFSDQVIYRFSKLQDTMGNRLFKAILLYQGEDVNKPFLDILNSLERMNLIFVEEWFYFREIRNEIAHEYEEDKGYKILNEIDKSLIKIKTILEKVKDIDG